MVTWSDLEAEHRRTPIRQPQPTDPFPRNDHISDFQKQCTVDIVCVTDQSERHLQNTPVIRTHAGYLPTLESLFRTIMSNNELATALQQHHNFRFPDHLLWISIRGLNIHGVLVTKVWLWQPAKELNEPFWWSVEQLLIGDQERGRLGLCPPQVWVHLQVQPGIWRVPW